MHRLLILLLAFSLSACAGVSSVAEGAGQFRTKVEVGTLAPGETPYIKSVEVIDGKESASVVAHLAFDENGRPSVVLERKDVKAFQGQAIAADLVDSVAKTTAATIAAILPMIMEMAKKSLVPLP